MPTSTLSSGTIYYAHHKAADARYPPLLLIHGAGGSHLDWPPQLRRLPGVPTFVIDLPAHGKSTGVSCSTVAGYAHRVAEFLAALSIDRAIIAGHSMGGAIAQQLALTAPQVVAGLILLGTGSKLPVEPTLSERIINQTEETLDWLVDWAWSEQTTPALKALARQRLPATPPEVLRDDFTACQSFDMRAKLAQISAPTLVIGAREDRMVKLKFSATLAERIPNAALVVIENAGHMFPLEHGADVAAHIRQWLTEHV